MPCISSDGELRKATGLPLSREGPWPAEARGRNRTQGWLSNRERHGVMPSSSSEPANKRLAHIDPHIAVRWQHRHSAKQAPLTFGEFAQPRPRMGRRSRAGKHFVIAVIVPRGCIGRGLAGEALEEPDRIRVPGIICPAGHGIALAIDALDPGLNL